MSISGKPEAKILQSAYRNAEKATDVLKRLMKKTRKLGNNLSRASERDKLAGSVLLGANAHALPATGKDVQPIDPVLLRLKAEKAKNVVEEIFPDSLSSKKEWKVAVHLKNKELRTQDMPGIMVRRCRESRIRVVQMPFLVPADIENELRVS